MNTNTHKGVIVAITLERYRQEELKGEGRFKYTPDEVPAILGHAMLSEEIGEVARCALSIEGDVQEDLTENDLYKELIQVAAVAAAMAEGILNRTFGGDPS